MQHPINQKQPLFMRWYEEYRERRYLVDASDEEVIQRSLHLTTNALSLTADGKIGMEAIETPQAAFIMRLYSHALEESRLRTGDYLGLFRNHGVRDFGPPHATVPAPPASPEILRISGEHPKYKWLFKFGKRQWVHDMLNHGKLRISPASAYDDPSLAPAVADNELSYDLATEAFDDDIMFLHPYQVRLADVTAPTGRRSGGRTACGRNGVENRQAQRICCARKAARRGNCLRVRLRDTSSRRSRTVDTMRRQERPHGSNCPTGARTPPAP